MMSGDRLKGFINSLYPENTEFLNRLEKEALKDEIPIIRKDTQGLIRFLISVKKPEKILEIGTAVGFSAILMAEYSPHNTRIITIEDYEKRIPAAKENIEKAGFSDKIKLLEGDAAKLLPEIDESFDLIFIDAAKAQYPVYLSESKRLLNPGGFIIADNCLQGGDILESRYAVERRDRTIHKRMREFLKEITSMKGFTSVLLPVGDGLAVAYRNEET